MEVHIIDTDKMTHDQREAIVRLEMSKYLSNPCPICGKQWKDVQDLIDSGAVYHGENTAAHKACWDRRKAQS